MEKILIDTDVIVDFLRGHRLRIKSFFSDIERRKIYGYLSVISLTELYEGLDNEEKEQALIKLISYFQLIPVDKNISLLAGKLKRQQYLGLADSLIAATCIDQNLSLFTFNKKHYQGIPNFELYGV